MRRFGTFAVLFAAAAMAAPAQMVVSAHSGTLDYFEGNVSIDGVQVKSQPGHFDELKEQSVLKTARGRAEVLLTPGVFLRVGENSQLRMLDNRLASTRVELVSGSATLESDAEPTANGKYKNPAVTLIFKSYEVEPVKDGLLEVTTDPAQVRVFKGEAKVQAGDNRVTVKDGREVFLTAALATDKFDEKTAADDNYMWARDRSAVVSAANLSSARMLANNSGGSFLGGGAGGGGFWGGSPWASSMFGGGWFFNPYFGMYTYMPLDGFAFSPFGYGFYSPMMINSVYMPGAAYWYGGGGARTASVTGRPVEGVGRIGRPVSGAGNVTRGLGLNSAAMRPVSPSANVISSRAASAAMVNRNGGFSRGGGFQGGGAAASAGGGSMAGRPSGGGTMAGGGARSAGGGPRGR
jgi:hypothetical protein